MDQHLKRCKCDRSRSRVFQDGRDPAAVDLHGGYRVLLGFYPRFSTGSATVRDRDPAAFAITSVSRLAAFLSLAYQMRSIDRR